MICLNVFSNICISVFSLFRNNVENFSQMFLEPIFVGWACPKEKKNEVKNINYLTMSQIMCQAVLVSHHAVVVSEETYHKTSDQAL